MRKEDLITFRLDPEKRAALDAIAELTDQDRSDLLNEAINAYLEVHQWQVEHIREGLRQAEAGEFATEAEVEAAFQKWRQ